ncbi:MAG: RtcB family protein [Pirellulales bacterium]
MPAGSFRGPLEKVSDYVWRIPKGYRPGMRVDGLVYADDRMIEQIRGDQALEQVANVAFLPGIQVASMAMPDIHWGYGFCIGGVCATDPAEGGVISPGGVGYDINCGVRLLRSDLTYREVKPRLERLMDELFKQIPAGTGRGGKYRYTEKELRRLLREGVRFLAQRGLATEGDILQTEDQGCLAGAQVEHVSQRAIERGSNQCGTLGSGNHFIEVQVVDAIFDEQAAGLMGLEKDHVAVMIHSGSRGLGYQVCDDAIRQLRHAPRQYGFELPDRQLVCAPVDSPEGEQYIGAMRAAANFAWCNRQLLMWQARESFQTVFGRPWESLKMNQVYDVAHNIAKFESHIVSGKKRKLWVHRKGATRAFAPGHPQLPDRYAGVGQPVLIPGDMGRASWVLVGQEGSMEQTFGTACHGAGRLMSRTKAVRHAAGRRIDRELARQGIIARARSRRGLAEEQPAAYKNVNDVVNIVHGAGLARKVARMRPIGVIKG